MKKIRRLDPIPHDLAFDILTLLPAKSLMRFKCVSKLWLSTVSDPSFVKSHRSRSLTRPDGSGLLISSTNSTFSKQHYFYTNRQGHSGRHELTLPIYHYYYSLTQAVNGLVCFYDGNRVSVCNISTHEVLTLPVTSFNVNDNANVNANLFFGTPRYYFGFDPVNEKYKLLNTCTFYTCGSPNAGDVEWEEWEILTLGTDSWRKIDAAPFKLQTQCIFIDRYIYWLHHIDQLSLVVVAFEVEDEQFHIFPVPQNAPHNLQPVQFGKRLALAGVANTDCLGRPNNHLELWILMDLINKRWTETCFHFPLAVLQRNCVLLPADHIPTGEILFTSPKFSLPLQVVYYDVKTKGWITIEIAELPLSEVLAGEGPLGKVCLTHYVENISPLLPLLNQ